MLAPSTCHACRVAGPGAERVRRRWGGGRRAPTWRGGGRGWLVPLQREAAAATSLLEVSCSAAQSPAASLDPSVAFSVASATAVAQRSPRRPCRQVVRGRSSSASDGSASQTSIAADNNEEALSSTSPSAWSMASRALAIKETALGTSRHRRNRFTYTDAAANARCAPHGPSATAYGRGRVGPSPVCKIQASWNPTHPLQKRGPTAFVFLP